MTRGPRRGAEWQDRGRPKAIWLPTLDLDAGHWPAWHGQMWERYRGGPDSAPRRGRRLPSSVRTACARRAHADKCGNATGRLPRKNLGHLTDGSMARTDWTMGFGSRSQ